MIEPSSRSDDGDEGGRMNRTSRVKNVTIESSKSSSMEVRVDSFSDPKAGAFGSCKQEKRTMT
jgi:hypothetical protein